MSVSVPRMVNGRLRAAWIEDLEANRVKLVEHAG